MAKPKTGTERSQRREAGRAVAEAKRADREARKLAKMLSRDARVNLEAIAASAHDEIRMARRDLDARPRRARRMARKAAARLERASVRATASGDTAERALAKSNVKKRAKTIKRRRAQAKQAQKMAKFVAFHTIAASITTPTDEERADDEEPHTKDLKRVRRRAKPAA